MSDRPFRIPRPTSQSVLDQADRAEQKRVRQMDVNEAADAAEAMTEAKARRRAVTKAIMSFLDIFEHRHTEPPKLVQEIIDHFDLPMAENLGTISVRRLQRAEKCLSAFVAAISADLE